MWRKHASNADMVLRCLRGASSLERLDRSLMRARNIDMSGITVLDMMVVDLPTTLWLAWKARRKSQAKVSCRATCSGNLTYRPVREKKVLSIHTCEKVNPRMATHSRIEYQKIRASVDWTVE